VGRYPEVGEKHYVNTSALTRQLPTIAMFQEGKEVNFQKYEPFNFLIL